jgi:methyl halide transferase
MQEPKKLNKDYWEARYTSQSATWDIGFPSPAITEYIKHLDRNLSILIPGCGNCYEAEYLLENNFTDVHLIDIAEEPLKGFAKRNSAFPLAKIHNEDFFSHNGSYDIIVEQTFFCALDPSLRLSYVRKIHELLKPDGILSGLLFNHIFDESGPPFGGTTEEYIQLFSPYFHINKAETAYNSILPRLNREIFIIFRKKLISHA